MPCDSSDLHFNEKEKKEAITRLRSSGMPRSGRSNSLTLLFIWKLGLTLMVRNKVASRSLSGQ